MIKFIFIPVAIMLSCGSTKNNQSAGKTDSAVVEQQVDMNKKDQVNELPDANGVMPKCIQNKIDSFKLKEAHEKPQRVIEYMYKGKKVYYVVMPCCDFYNEVYDVNCNFLGAPDGGFTGKGDGKIPDFFEEAKSEKLVWGTPK
jgi:hypothetical protein